MSENKIVTGMREAVEYAKEQAAYARGFADARERAEQVAEAARRQAEQDAKDDRLELGDMYDPNCYGTGRTAGEGSAAYDIAEGIRALQPTEKLKEPRDE